ncbi:MAG: hypothetical protein UZ14_CFX002001319 [Chloroflexi bacterium OLB14]|nr:MAG: hypothetical protein UZ14_CFX002001319 [Chloroflexi bacterium OLB14]
MKIIKDEKKIERNKKFSQWISLGALLVLGGGMYISITRPELFFVSLGCLLVGFIATQVGMYMGNRWGRSPRPDEKLDAGLKGLHSEFNIYHYTSPVPHLLIGPAGVWVLKPYHQGGKIFYENKKWKNKGGGFFAGYMRIFGQEGIGRPDLEAESEIEAVEKFLKKNITGENAIPEVKAILLFTNENVELEVNDSPIPAMKLKQIKDFMRQMSKNRVLSSGQINEIANLLPKA